MSDQQKSLTLTDKQQKVYDRIMNASGNQLTVLKGFAGTGKTSTAAKIIEDMVNDHHRRVLVAAPTAAALAVLKQKLSHIKNTPDGFVTFKTIAQLLTTPQRYVELKMNGNSFGTYSLESEDSVDEFRQTLKQIGLQQATINRTISQFTKVVKTDGELKHEKQFDVNQPALLQALKTSPIGSNINDDDVNVDVRFIPREPSQVAYAVHYYDLIMLDEISMIGDSSMILFDQMLDHLGKEYPHTKKKDATDADHTFTQVLMCGDPAQLPPVKDNLNSHIKATPNNQDVFQLTDILRSTDAVSQVAQLVRSGVSFSDLAEFYPDNVIDIHDTDPKEYIDQNIAELAKADVVLTFRNKYVNQLNTRLRTQEGHESDTIEFNDRLLVTRNSGYNPDTHEVMYPNGSQYTVSKIYTKEEVRQMLDDFSAAAVVDEQKAKELDHDQQAINLENSNFIALVRTMFETGLIELVDLKSKIGDTSTAWVFCDNAEWKHRYDRNYQTAEKNVNNFAQISAEFFGKFIPLVHTAFGYAMTVHKSQGSEWPSVAYLVTEKDLNIMRGKPNLSYTAVSRAKDDVKIFYLH